MQCCLLEI